MKIEEILSKAMSNNIPEGYCYHCRGPIKDYKRNKKFCSETCKYDHYHYGHTKPKFINYKYMRIYLGKGIEKGQGKRFGHMVRGGMAVYTSQWSDPVSLTPENIEKSICSEREGISLCNGTILEKEEALMLAEYLQKLNV